MIRSSVSQAKILLSINCLAEMLNTLLMVNGIIKAPMPVGLTLLQREMMKQSGYCPNTIAHIASAISSPSCLFFISNMRPAFVHGHTNCSDEICTRSTLDKNLYVREHASQCDKKDCQDICVEDFHVQPEGDRPVSRVLEAGEIPVVTVDCESDLPTISISSSSNVGGLGESTSIISYVAISHVWSEYV
jgi:hypothetical protein